MKNETVASQREVFLHSQLNSLCASLYLIDPVVESGDTSKDSGFLHIVAAEARDEAGNAVDLPGTLCILTVKRATGVTLNTGREGLYFIYLVGPLADWQGTTMRITIRITVSPSLLGTQGTFVLSVMQEEIVYSDSLDMP